MSKTTPTQTGPTDVAPIRPSAWRRARPALAVVAVTAIGAGILLGGRALIENHYHEARTYDTASAIPEHNGIFRLPEWAPTDARDITISADTRGRGRTVVLTSASDPSGSCETSDVPDRGPVPDLALPRELADRQGLRCGEWFVIRDDSTYYAWQAWKGTS